MCVPVLVVVSRSLSCVMPCVRVLVSYGMQVCLMVVSYLDSLLLYDHIHHIQNNVHLGNDVQCSLILGTGSIDLPCWTITLTVDEGNRVAVNCCTAWRFSTSLMVFY